MIFNTSNNLLTVLSMASSRFERSLAIRDFIVAESNADPRRTSQHSHTAEEIMFMHILNCIGALSCIRANQKTKQPNICRMDNSEGEQASALRSCKHRVFWQAVREIADREVGLEDIPDTEDEREKSSALDFMLDCFPDDTTKRSDGRLWLPLHLAVSIPSSRLEDIHTLFTADPAAIKAPADETNQLNPCHLAVMMKNPRMDIIPQLQIYDPGFGLSKDRFRNTPLHLAARYSDSVAMVRELAQLHPAALEMKNDEGDTPVHLAVYYSSSVELLRELASLSPAALVTMNKNGATPLAAAINTDYSPEFDIKLRLLLEAAPQAARIVCPSYIADGLALHQILRRRNPPATLEQVAMVLATHREAVDMLNYHGFLPIHTAAKFASLEAMKMIAEENISNLSVISPACGSVAHMAVYQNHLQNLQYIHSLAPELLLSVDEQNRTPLHYLGTRNLSPPLSVKSDVLRFLLRHCPSSAAARDNYGSTLYDYLPAEDEELAYARRLVLLAGASSLYPGVLQELNYAARREALLLFHSSSSSPVTKPSIFSRIRNGAGGPELMRTIVCFL